MVPSSDTARDAAVGRLAAGRTPDGVWSAPGRVNLIGEHTDYNDGFALPFAIDARTWCAAAVHDVAALFVSSTAAEEPIAVPLAELPTFFDPEMVVPAGRGHGAPDRDGNGVPTWSAYPLGVAWALLKAAGRTDPADVAALPGVELAFASDVPVGGGLSSSAALECAAAVALNELWDLGLAPMDLARAGRRAENEAVGAPTGIMDQVAVMLGRDDAATFLDCRSLETRSVDLGLAGAGLTVLVVDTRVEHAHADGGYRSRREACEEAARALGVPALRDVDAAGLEAGADLMDEVTLRRARHVVTENQRVLDTVAVLDAEGAGAIGELLTASHASMRDDFENSVPEVDLAVETALSHGALGARMTGGGFGGSVIALVPEARLGEVARAVTDAFAGAGHAEPRVFPVRPSRGAL